MHRINFTSPSNPTPQDVHKSTSPNVELAPASCFLNEGGDCVINETVKEPVRRDGADVIVSGCVQLDVLVPVRLLSLACIFLSEMRY